MSCPSSKGVREVRGRIKTTKLGDLLDRQIAIQQAIEGYCLTIFIQNILKILLLLLQFSTEYTRSTTQALSYRLNIAKVA
jgi:hypothetical protein